LTQSGHAAAGSNWTGVGSTQEYLVAKFGSQHGVGRKDDQGGDATRERAPSALHGNYLRFWILSSWLAMVTLRKRP